MNILSALVGIVVAGVILIAIIVRLLAWLYVRASGETAFVRTGTGGIRVIRNGGGFVIPVLHQTVPVSLNTLRLEVARRERQALITKDRMRVDVEAAFYVRVPPEAEAIIRAAQTLGTKILSPDALRELVEGKFIDALRSVAAVMTMEELHGNRSAFVRQVRELLLEDLAKNGLELESVSLIELEQTERRFFNPENAFDAEGLTRLTKDIEDRRRMRDAIEKDTEVALRQKALEVERQKLEIEKLKLEIDREAEEAKALQRRAVVTFAAEQEAETTVQRAERRRAAEEAEISARREVERAEIEAKRELERQRVAAEQAVAEARIAMEREVKLAETARAKAVDVEVIARNRDVGLAEAARAIAIAGAARDKFKAEAEADEARVLAARAEEAVTTGREEVRAERDKLVGAVKAEAQRIVAEGDADAQRIRLVTREKELAVEAQGRRAINEARNALSPEQAALRVRLASIERLPEIIRESAKPMERIDDIKIIQVEGLGGGGSGANGHAFDPGGQGHSLADQVTTSALRYRAQAPLVDAILREVGLEGGTLRSLASAVAPPSAPAIASAPSEPKLPAAAE